MKKFELNPKLDNRKSFNKKALIIELEDCYILQSYDTKICKILKKDLKSPKIKGFYSQTTLRHLKEILYQFSSLNLNEFDKKSKLVKYLTKEVDF